jgi:hypothetical protein
MSSSISRGHRSDDGDFDDVVMTEEVIGDDL